MAARHISAGAPSPKTLVEPEEPLPRGSSDVEAWEHGGQKRTNTEILRATILSCPRNSRDVKLDLYRRVFRNDRGNHDDQRGPSSVTGFLDRPGTHSFALYSRWNVPGGETITDCNICSVDVKGFQNRYSCSGRFDHKKVNIHNLCAAFCTSVLFFRSPFSLLIIDERLDSLLG